MTVFPLWDFRPGGRYSPQGGAGAPEGIRMTQPLVRTAGPRGDRPRGLSSPIMVPVRNEGAFIEDDA